MQPCAIMKQIAVLGSLAESDAGGWEIVSDCPRPTSDTATQFGESLLRSSH